MLARISLRWRLLGVGLLCAVLTGLSGGAGILSLRMINDRMLQSTTGIREALSEQTTLIRQLIELRALLGRIMNAENQTALLMTEMDLEAIKADWNHSLNPANAAVLSTADELVSQRRNVLTAKARLDSLRYRTSEALSTITALALQTADDAEFDAAISIDASLGGIEETLTLLDGSRVANSDDSGVLLDGLKKQIVDEIAGMSELGQHALDTTAMAWRMRGNYNQLVAIVNESLLSTDVDFVRYQGRRCRSLLVGTAKELSYLVGETRTNEIADLLAELDQLVRHTHETKCDVLLAQESAHQTLKSVIQAVDQLDISITHRTVLTEQGAADAMRAMTRTIAASQRIQLSLVVVSFVLAIGIGILFSRSVLRQIRSLNDGIAMVAQGKLDGRVDTGTLDEIGQLSRAFDAMTESLSERDRSIRESEQRFRSLFEESNDGVLILDSNRRIVDVNHRLCEIIDYDRDALLSRPVSDLHAPEDLVTSPLSTRPLTEYEPGRSESRYRRSDGRSIDVEISASLADRDQGLTQAMVRDISDRKRTEQELQRHLEEISQGKHRLEILVSNTTERELRMVQLKEEVNDLLVQAGRARRYEAPEQVRRARAKISESSRQTNGATTCP